MVGRVQPRHRLGVFSIFQSGLGAGVTALLFFPIYGTRHSLNQWWLLVSSQRVHSLLVTWYSVQSLVSYAGRTILYSDPVRAIF